MRSKRLALFDFDGTITWLDSFFLFILFSFFYNPFHHLKVTINSIGVYWRFKRGFLSRHESKQRIFSNYFGIISITEYQNLCMRFSKYILPLICRTAAMNKLRMHLEKGDEVYLVSASPQSYLLNWANKYSLNIIATKEERNGFFLTGNFDTQNCWGAEKGIRIKSQIDLSDYTEIHVYGNSEGDCAMFALATHPYYKCFDQPNIPPCK
jgi:phosphatidylglycerophosphatase C